MPNEEKPKQGIKLRVFKSFHEQENEMIEYWASITPQKRLAHLYEMIKVSFRLTETIQKPPHTLQIISYEL